MLDRGRVERTTRSVLPRHARPVSADPATRAGGGMQVPVVDIDGDADQDIVVGGKPGLFLFENLAVEPRGPETI